MSRAAENHPDTLLGALRPPATLVGAREKAEWAEPLVTLLQAQGHNPRQTQELGETAWVPHPGCPRRDSWGPFPVTRNTTLTSVKCF